jgi:hypothetical protein
MKHIKYILLGLIAIFAPISSSKASIGVTTSYDVLTITTTITTNALSTTNNNIIANTVLTTKFTTKDLLSLFASWAGTNWPSGAQVVAAWDDPWYGDIVVVDKTGTNVLFDASASNYPDQYFTIDFIDGEGAYSSTLDDNDPGYFNYTWYKIGSFQLFDDVNNIFLSGQGPNTEVLSQKWDKNGSYSSWSDSETCTANGAGTGEVLNGEFVVYTSVTATISAKGKGTGENSFNETY